MAVFTDVQWSAIEPLIEAVRPQTGRELTNLRSTIEAIIWRMQNGAKWRAIPGELGPWWMAAQTFLRWSKLGVWERFFEAAKAAGWPALGMVFMDSTIIRAHQKAAGAAKRGTTQLSRRAQTTKRWAAARAASAPRPMPLPMRGAARWALLSRPGRQARRPKASISSPFCLPSQAGWSRIAATRLTRCARRCGSWAPDRPSRPGAPKGPSTARTGSM
jgi:transposase